jgi:paraquat-inducible protein B
MSDAGDTTLRAPKVTRRAALSPVWLAPLLALAIAGAVAWRYYAALGPTVEIALEAGGGVAAGATAVRYRGVDIGLVEEVRLAPDLDGVVAVARLDPSVEPRLTEATTFWVVRPVVSAGQVEGLDTLLSGVYLGVAFGDGGAPVRRFEALAAPPLTPPGAAGQRITLRAPAGAALSPGAPVYFKSIEVGQVEARHLADDAGSVLFDIFVNAPHDARITPQTRFWDVSGFNASFDANGLSLKVESLVSILRGGVAFDAIDGAVGVADGAVRTLYGSREAAEGSVFEAEPHRQLRYSIAFRQSVRGLAIGAPVEYRGVQIGEVESLAIAPGQRRRRHADHRVPRPAAAPARPGRPRPRGVAGLFRPLRRPRPARPPRKRQPRHRRALCRVCRPCRGRAGRDRLRPPGPAPAGRPARARRDSAPRCRACSTARRSCRSKR